jgi:hypothetical protein
MNLFGEYMANAKATKHLQPRYYLLTTCVGFGAVLTGIVAWYRCTEAVASIVGMPYDQPVEGAPQIAVVAGWLLLGLPTFLYLAGVLVGGLTGGILAATGKVSRHEAVWYALLSRYPPSWFKAAGDA